MIRRPRKDEHFSYTKLRDDQIRLFQLGLEVTYLGRTCLSISIHHFDRQEAPSYVAVSYEWGPKAPANVIIVNGKFFVVRRNLWWCLTFMPRKGMYFWVDAICLNQDDIRERNEQVRRMDRIYSDAAGVLIWLPLEESQMTDAYRCKQQALSESQLRPSIMCHSYWTRTWVIQEILLARDVIYLCGNRLLRDQSVQLMRDGLSTRMFSPRLWTHNQIWRQVGGIKEKRPTFSLIKVLRLSRDSKCKDPRDKIFALLSLLEDNERLALGRVFPDYSLTTEQVQLLTLCYLNMRYGLVHRRLGWKFIRSWGVIPPDEKGIDSEKQLNGMISRVLTLSEPKIFKRRRIWTLKILLHYLSRNRPANAIEERKATQARGDEESWQVIADELQAISDMIQ